MNGTRRIWTRTVVASLAVALLGAGSFVLGGSPAAADTAIAAKPSLSGSVGIDSMVVKWGAVSGAKGYHVQWSRYSTFSKYVHDVNVTDAAKTQVLLTGMGGDVTYYFRVRTYNFSNNAPMSAYSPNWSAHTKYSTSKKTTAIQLTNISGTSVELNWGNIGGSVSGYQIKASASGKPTVYASTTSTGITVKGLVKSTPYKLYIAAAETVDTAVVFVPTAGPNSVRTGPFTTGKSFTTSSYPLAAPSEIVARNATPYTVDLSWTVPDGFANYPGAKFRIDYALDSAIKESPAYQIVSGPTSTVLGSVTPLKENTQYYVRIRVVDADGTTIRSDRSDYVLAKTRIPYGTVKGTVNGPSGGDVVVAAFKGNDLITQVPVESDRTYEMKLRPGTYRLKAIYVGAGNYTSLWLWAGNPGGRFIDESSVITVEKDGDLTAPTVTLAKGGVVSGTASGAGGGVDVTAMIRTPSGGLEVVGMDRADNAGAYSITGLRDGDYYIRFRKTGYDIETKSTTITGASTHTVNAGMQPH